MARPTPSPSIRNIFAPVALTVSFLILASSDALSQRVIKAIRAESPISIDGILSEPEWQGKGYGGLIQRMPNAGAPCTERTEVWVAYDDDALYVAAHLFDSQPDSIVGRLVRRDEDFESDHFFIEIDSNHDRVTGYYFGTNPSGSKQDGIIFSDTKSDRSFDAVWNVATHVDRTGWTAEFRIPYSQLRFAKQDHYVWGFEVVRRIHRKNEEAYFTYYPRNDEVRVSRWPELVGITGIVPPPRIEVSPYVVGTGKFLQKPPVASFNQGRTDPFVLGRDFFGSVGADAKIGLDGNFTLDASLNPDFAQVEVDPAVINLTAYETYYQEKRPFFIEGSSILSFGKGGATEFPDYSWTDPSFFYSRRIGRAPQGSVTHDGFTSIPDRTTIIGAAKVSGKTNTGWSLAGLTAVTAREFGLVDSAGVRFSEEVEPLTFYGIARIQKQSEGSRQAIGMIATLVERDQKEHSIANLLNHRAFSFGIDGWSFLDDDKNWVITGWTGLTDVQGTRSRMIDLQQAPQHYFQRPDQTHVHLDSTATSLVGWAGRVWLNKDKGNWHFNAAVGAISPSFESNDLGYHTFTDLIDTHIYTGYSWYEPDRFFRTKALYLYGLRQYNFGGLRVAETYYFNAVAELLSYWGAEMFLGYSPEAWDDKRTRGGPLMKSLSSEFLFLNFNSDTRKDLSGYLSLNFDRGESGGWDYGGSLTLSWNITPAMKLNFGPSYYFNHAVAQYVDAIPDTTATKTYGTSYIFSTLDQRTLAATMRLNWTFTPRLSVQVYLQPYLSAGSYSGFKELAEAGTYSFIPTTYPTNPDFNFKSLRANAVLRWEYLPGSTLYFVWTNEKVNFEQNYGVFRAGRDFAEMLRARPDNIFSLKITYWWSP